MKLILEAIKSLFRKIEAMRTHWEEQGEVVVLPEATVTIDEEDDGYETLSEEFPQLIVGEKYIVLFNGVRYECIARALNEDCVLIGNGTIYGDDNLGNNEPFSCDSYENGTIYLNVAVAGEYTISILQETIIVHKLDEKYLPDSVKGATQSDWNQNDETAPDYIKNKPFYENLVGARVFVAKQEFTASEGNNISVESDGYINNSKTYVAHFDGVSHICELRYDDPDFSIQFYHNGHCIATDGWNLWLPFELEGNHVIEIIECDSADIKEISEHFIPQTIARDALKLDKINPVGSGSIGIGRKEDSVIGNNSQAFGEGVVAEGAWQFTQGKYNIKSDIYTINQYRGTVLLYSSDLHLCGSDYTFDEINGTYTLIDEREEFPENIPIGFYFIENRYDSRRNIIYYRDSDTIIESVNNIRKKFTNVLVLDRTYAPFSGGKYAHIVGNGTSDDARSNAHTLDWEGLGWFKGGLKIGGTSQDDANAKEVALKEDIPDTSNLALKTEIPNVDSYITTHNTSTASHNDIRDLITGLTNRLNALADSDDTTLDQLSEIVNYIKSNKELIDAVTTSKVNISDIVDNLTTNVSNKPLSAAQGVALKALIDAIAVPTKVSELTNDSGYITGYTETDPTVPAWAKATTKPSYTKSEVGLSNVDNVKQYSASNPPPLSCNFCER